MAKLRLLPPTLSLIPICLLVCGLTVTWTHSMYCQMSYQDYGKQGGLNVLAQIPMAFDVASAGVFHAMS